MAEKGFDLQTQVDNGPEDNRGGIEQYQIPEMGSEFPRQQTAADFAEDALDRGVVPIDDIDDTDQKKGISRRKLVIAGLAAAVGLAAGGAFAVKALNSNEGNNLPPENAPGTSAPQVPGQTETSTSAPEKEFTAETVPFTVNGKEVIGVNTMTGIAAELQVTRANDPKLPAPTEAEGMQYWTKYLHALQEMANMPITADNEKFVPAANQAVLFHEGTSGALQDFIQRIQTQKEREKIVSIELPKTLRGKPDKVNIAQAHAYIITKDATGEERRYYVSASVEAQWGVGKVGNVSQVNLEP